MATIEVDKVGNATVKSVGQRIKETLERWRQDGTLKEAEAVLRKALRRPTASYPDHDDGDEGRGLNGERGVL